MPTKMVASASKEQRDLRPPPVQFVERLMASRRTGAPFDIAWMGAMKRCHWPSGGRQIREEWIEVMESTKAAYEDAYVQRPTRGAAAIMMLALRLPLEVAAVGDIERMAA